MQRLRRAGLALLFAGVCGVVTGCGGDLLVARDEGTGSVAGGGLILADTTTQLHYSLNVADGSPTLTEIGGTGTAPAGSELIDSTSGGHFSVVVTSGALTLVPEASGSSASAQIALVDSVTTKTYELAVTSGALTLTLK